MSMTNQKANYQNNINWLLLKVLTLLVLIYLVAIPLGYVNKKFELTDVIIFAIILIFNSELIERLIKLGINKDGITLDLSQIKAEQDNQKASIETNTANIEAITNIVQRLTILEQEIANSKSETQLLVNSLLSEYELKHLRRLATDTSFSYRKHRSFEQELRHLRALGFIENKPGKTISSMPEKGDLRDYLAITDYGREYLKRREQLETEYNYSSEPIS